MFFQKITGLYIYQEIYRKWKFHLIQVPSYSRWSPKWSPGLSPESSPNAISGWIEKPSCWGVHVLIQKTWPWTIVGAKWNQNLQEASIKGPSQSLLILSQTDKNMAVIEDSSFWFAEHTKDFSSKTIGHMEKIFITWHLCKAFYKLCSFCHDQTKNMAAIEDSCFDWLDIKSLFSETASQNEQYLT